MTSQSLAARKRNYRAGTQIGAFEIVRRLNDGGMGEVYLARPRPKYAQLAPPQVVLKMAYDSHNDFLLNEIEHLSVLQHPQPHANIINVMPLPNTQTSIQTRGIYTARAEPKAADSPYYIVIDYMRGGSLENLLKVRGKLSPAEAIEITLQLCDALMYMHSRQLIHLDIKDGNILFREAFGRFQGRVPQVVLSDFGISEEMNRPKFTTIFGSPQYTAPERAHQKAAPHPQHDVYGVGVLLYQMLTGKFPFSATPIPGTPLNDNLRPSMLNRAVSTDLEQIVLRAIMTDPSQRYLSIAQLKQDLDRLGLRRPVTVRTPLIHGAREAIALSLSALLVTIVSVVIAVFVLTGVPSPSDEDVSAPTNTLSAPTNAPTSTFLPETNTSAPPPATATAEPTAGRATSTSLPTSPTPRRTSTSTATP